jgi:hypothetical protein
MLDEELLRFHLQDPSNYVNWSNSLGFISLYSIYENIARLEYDLLITPYENMTSEEMKNIPNPGHTEDYLKAVADEVILEINEGNGKTSPKLNCYQINHAPFLNRYGFVKIGNDLFQFKGDFVKCMKNANINNVAMEELNRAGNDNLTKGITVVNLNKRSRATGSLNFQRVLDNTCTGSSFCYGWNGTGSRRTSFDMFYSVDWTGTSVNSASNHKFNISMNTKTQQKNFWGNYVDKTGTHTFNCIISQATCDLADVNGNSINNPSFSVPYYYNYGYPILQPLNLPISDNGTSTSFNVTLASNNTYNSPILTSPPFGLVQSYFKDPSNSLKWHWKAVTQINSDFITVTNTKN